MLFFAQLVEKADAMRNEILMIQTSAFVEKEISKNTITSRSGVFRVKVPIEQYVQHCANEDRLRARISERGRE